MVQLITFSPTTVLVLHPNRSASWQQTKLFIAAAWAVIATVAIGWSVVGAWVVLPFAGIEMLLLGFVMYKVCYNSYQKQVITINGNTITVEWGVYRPSKIRHFDRTRTHLEIIEADNTFDPAILCLKDEHQRLPIGQFLNKQDIEETLSRLKQAGVMVCSNHWWKENR